MRQAPRLLPLAQGFLALALVLVLQACASSDKPKPGSFSRAPSGILGGASGTPSGGPSGAAGVYPDSTEDEYSLVEPMERCAICGLSGEEAEKLQLYTGEMLGEMFSCDGNCGHQFHVRCVGKSDEAF